jgi:hypothetical protein
LKDTDGEAVANYLLQVSEDVERVVYHATGRGGKSAGGVARVPDDMQDSAAYSNENVLGVESVCGLSVGVDNAVIIVRDDYPDTEQEAVPGGFSCAGLPTGCRWTATVCFAWMKRGMYPFIEKIEVQYIILVDNSYGAIGF